MDKKTEKKILNITDFEIVKNMVDYGLEYQRIEMESVSTMSDTELVTDLVDSAWISGAAQEDEAQWCDALLYVYEDDDYEAVQEMIRNRIQNIDPTGAVEYLQSRLASSLLIVKPPYSLNGDRIPFLSRWDIMIFQELLSKERRMLAQELTDLNPESRKNLGECAKACEKSETLRKKKSLEDLEALNRKLRAFELLYLNGVVETKLKKEFKEVLKPAGEWIKYHNNGQLWQKGNYVDGKEEGEWVYCNQDGSIDLDRTGVYITGVKR